MLLLDEPTNNLDPASREEILGALRTYKGAVVLVTHDEGAVEALQPERIILLPGRRRGPVGRRTTRTWSPSPDPPAACRRRVIDRLIHCRMDHSAQRVIHHLSEICLVPRCVATIDLTAEPVVGQGSAVVDVA